MSEVEPRRYDVAIVGAGPVGSLCALAHARNGRSVGLLEANPNTAKRLAGEWLHPPAMRILSELGIEPDADAGCTPGKGFVVFPEDGGEPILLPYPDGRHGVAWEHEGLVSRLRQAVADEPSVDCMMNARVRGFEGDRISYTRNGDAGSVEAKLIVGADGRGSVVRRSLGLPTRPQPCSRMLGVMLDDVSLPFEGYGHVICAEPGPILIYRLGERSVRLLVDIPSGYSTRDMMGALARSYADSLPDTLGPALLEALRKRQFLAATNALRPRHSYGTPGRVLIGDAAGHYHPLTAVGLTLGFGDAFALAEGGDFRDFANRRLRETRAPELLAMGLYEVFADRRVEAAALRHTIYRQWRDKPAIRERTIRLLACEDTSVASLGWALGATATRAVAAEVTQPHKPSALRRTGRLVHALAVRFLSLGRGMRQLRNAGGVTAKEERARATLSGAFPVSMPRPDEDPRPGRIGESAPPDASSAITSATAHLLSLQRDDGSWEGEVAWCPMLTAQYVMLHHITGQPLDPDRRRLVLRSFEHTRLEGGAWGLHEHSPPHLFVTTLVYVAARLLGVEPDDPLIVPARRFLQAEGVLNIPTWGKFWLALLNLYDWRGVNPVLPELWRLPRRMPLHPSNWYCHTRLIYMAMAAVYPVAVPGAGHVRDRITAGGVVPRRVRQRGLCRRPQPVAGRRPLRPSRRVPAGRVRARPAVRAVREQAAAGPLHRRPHRSHPMGAADHRPHEHLPGQRPAQHSLPMAA